MFLGPFLVCILLFFLGAWFIYVDITRHVEKQKQVALQLAGTQASIMSQQLNAAISLSYTLETILSVNQYKVQTDHFEKIATHLIDAHPAVSSLQYAPGGIVRYVVPLRGNESAIGHNLFEDPKRNKEAYVAIEKRRLTVAGPFELIQGGFALAARLPIFQTKNRKDVFWGFSTVLIRISDLLNVSNFSMLETQGYEWVLWRVHPDTEVAHIFSGSSDSLINDSVQLTIQVPNASWNLNIKPRQGWLAGEHWRLTLEIGILLLISGFGASFIFFLQRQPLLLQQKVNARTTELQEAISKLRSSEERFRQIFETSPDPVLITKMEDGTIIDINKAFVTTTGLSQSKVLGHNASELGLWVDDDLQKTFREQLRSHFEINNFEAEFYVQGGQTRIGHLSTRLLNIDMNAYALIVIHDITTEKEAEQALTKMDKIKSELISTAAHELRTPLSVMMGYTELLIKPETFGEFTDVQKSEFLNDVYEKGESLSLIVDDLLDVSRIESGHPITLNLQESDLTDTLSKTVAFFRAHNVKHTFQLNLPEGFDQLMMLIDRHRINQVLENLLSNAVKYSPTGGNIIVTLSVVSGGYEISVEDKGIGMEQKDIERIFDKFYRADSSNTAIGGFGLGMSIAKQVVEAHGGSIWVESTKGRGSTFTFNLPCAE